jgi:hypothetical protein
MGIEDAAGMSEFEAYRDETFDPPALIVQVGKTEVRNQLHGLDDLHQMLKQHGDWMPLGSADELVRAEERAARPVRHVRPTGDGSYGASRGRAPSEKQPNASSLSRPGVGAA